MDYAEREEHVQLAAQLVDIVGPNDPRGLPTRIALQVDWLETADARKPWAQDLASMLIALLDALQERARTDREAWFTLTRIVRAMVERESATALSGTLGNRLAALSHRLFVAADLPQPRRGSATPAGDGPASGSVSRAGVAVLVDAVARQLSRNGYRPPLYASEESSTRPGLTVVGILREAFTDRGVPLRYGEIVDIYEEAQGHQVA
jgi:hypothetical protein